MAERGAYNRAARRSGGARRFTVSTAGILVGAKCGECGAEKIAVMPIVHARCLACGAVYLGEGEGKKEEEQP